jgi:hypothetical protein
MSVQEFKSLIVENGYKITDNIHEGIYILEDGSLIDGEFDPYAGRCEDHRMMESFTDKERYDDDFWDHITREFNVVMVVPETEFILLKPWQNVTPEQQRVMDALGYEVDHY